MPVPNVQFAERLYYIVSLADERTEEIGILWQGDRVRNSPVVWAGAGRAAESLETRKSSPSSASGPGRRCPTATAGTS